MPWNIYVYCFAWKTTLRLVLCTKIKFVIAWSVIIDKCRFVFESLCSWYMFKLWQTKQRVSCLNRCANAIALCPIIQKIEMTHCKVEQHKQKKLNRHHNITSQFAHYNFSVPGGIIQLSFCLRLLICPRPHKKALCESGAVAFKYID